MFVVTRMLPSQIDAIDVFTSTQYIGFNRTRRSNVARNCQRVIYIFYLLRKGSHNLRSSRFILLNVLRIFNKWRKTFNKIKRLLRRLRPTQTGRDSATQREIFSFQKQIKPSTGKNFTRYADQIAKIA
jgi:hypothetical protein